MSKRQWSLFNRVGIGIVLLWVVLMAVQVQKAEFGRTTHSGGGVAQAITNHQRDWLEIRLDNQKVGYAFSQVTPLTEGYLIQEEIFLSLNVLGQGTMVQTLSRALVDRNFLLNSFRFRMNSGVVAFQVAGNVEGNQIVLEIG